MVGDQDIPYIVSDLSTSHELAGSYQWLEAARTLESNRDCIYCYWNRSDYFEHGGDAVAHTSR